MKERRKLKVGEKLWLVRRGNWVRGNHQEGKEGNIFRVTTVGRKYFKGLRTGSKIEITFHIDTWREKIGYTPSYYLYESEQEWRNLVEREVLFDLILKIYPETKKKSILCSN